jgi:hypothetical protein
MKEIRNVDGQYLAHWSENTGDLFVSAPVDDENFSVNPGLMRFMLLLPSDSDSAGNMQNPELCIIVCCEVT